MVRCCWLYIDEVCVGTLFVAVLLIVHCCSGICSAPHTPDSLLFFSFRCSFSCYRRLGSYQKALELYEQIHKEYPQNLECLRYLVAICKELGMPYDEHEQYVFDGFE